MTFGRGPDDEGSSAIYYRILPSTQIQETTYAVRKILNTLREGGGMAKSSLYKEMIKRLDDACANRHFLEASWYAYAVLEDRLISLIKSGGGVPGRLMMGKKIEALDKLVKAGTVELRNFESTKLRAWADDRNTLMHAMAEGKMTIEDVDAMAEKLANDGSTLVRIYAAAAMRQKKKV
jgi:hypothetical protein